MTEDNRGRREQRRLAVRPVEPVQLGLAGAAQLGCLHRQRDKDSDWEIDYLVTSRPAARLSAEEFFALDLQASGGVGRGGCLSPEQFLLMDRKYWGIENGLHQRLDCSGFEDRLRVRHPGAVHILGLFHRVSVALFVRWASQQRRVRDRTYPTFKDRHLGNRWQMIRQVTEPP